MPQINIRIDDDQVFVLDVEVAHRRHVYENP